jgi:hypothetical protein
VTIIPLDKISGGGVSKAQSDAAARVTNGRAREALSFVGYDDEVRVTVTAVVAIEVTPRLLGVWSVLRRCNRGFGATLCLADRARDAVRVRPHVRVRDGRRCA